MNEDDSRVETARLSRPSARDAILRVAEALFGERGIAGVALREIGAMAGQRNNSAVSYHFRDKQGLVNALLEDRVSKAERLRQERVDALPNLAGLSASALLRLLWEPVIDLDSGNERHAFVRFFLTYQLDPGPEYPSHAAPERYPASVRVLTTLRSKFPHLSEGEFHYRLALLAMMTWAAVSWQDNKVAAGAEDPIRAFSIDRMVRMAVASLMLPE